MLGYGSYNNDPNTPSLEQYANALESILAQMGLNPTEVRLNTDDGYGWSFRRGSAVIEIYVAAQNGVGYLQVLSPILHLPENAILPLYRRLLELNLQLTSAALGVYGDVVYVFSERPLAGLDVNEANEIVSRVAAYADDLDNALVEEFGGRLYMQA